MNKKERLALILAGLITLSACSSKTVDVEENSKKSEEEILVQVIPKDIYLEKDILEYVVSCGSDIYATYYEDCVYISKVIDGYSLLDVNTYIKKIRF